MPIGGEQAVRDHKAGSRNARSQKRCPTAKPNIVDTEDVADGVAIMIQDQGRHRLLLFQLLDLMREFLNLLFEWVRSRGRIVVRQQESGDEKKSHDDSLDSPLPDTTDRLFLDLWVAL